MTQSEKNGLWVMLGIVVVLVACICLCCGCTTPMQGWVKEAIEDWRKSEEKPAPNEDALDLASVDWLGSSYAGATIGATLNSASMDSRMIHVSYQPYAWPEKTVGGARVDAICCLFYERGGKVVGGKFDWWRVGGQADKVLHNVHNGYQGHSYPEAGARAWTMNVSVDGSRRTQVIEVSR